MANTKTLDPLTHKSGDPLHRAKKGEALATRDLTKGRICNSCNLYKERDQFNEHPRGFNGLCSSCKECVAQKDRNSPEHRRVLYAKRKNEGSCVRCGANELVNGCLCERCWFADKAIGKAGGVSKLPALMELWEQQDGKCYYTGVKLTPGDNASLDHQIPKARGGSNDPLNLKWVALKINVMKGTMTHAEFITLCKIIASRFSDETEWSDEKTIDAFFKQGWFEYNGNDNDEQV